MSEEVKNLAGAIKDDATSDSEEHGVILQGYSNVQSEANLFPVNEIEEQRLWKMAMLMFYLGRSYERLYSYENQLVV